MKLNYDHMCGSWQRAIDEYAKEFGLNDAKFSIRMLYWCSEHLALKNESMSRDSYLDQLEVYYDKLNDALDYLLESNGNYKEYQKDYSFFVKISGIGEQDYDNMTVDEVTQNRINFLETDNMLLMSHLGL